MFQNLYSIVTVADHVAIVQCQCGGCLVRVPQHFQCQLVGLTGGLYGLITELRALCHQLLILTVGRIHGGAFLVISLGMSSQRQAQQSQQSQRFEYGQRTP